MSLKLIKIGDLGEVITGNTPPKKDPENYGGDYPFIKPTDMDIDKKYVTEWDETYSEKAYNKYHRAYIPPGATGVVTIGTVGEKLFQAHQHCFTNQSVNVIIPNDNYYDDYVFYLMKLNLPKVENANPGTASGRHHVSKSNFCSIKVDVVECLNSQKRIADILSAYDDLIENNLKRIKLLEKAAQNIYKEWFVNLRFPGHENTPINEETGLPLGWEEKGLCEFNSFKQYKAKIKVYEGEKEYLATANVDGIKISERGEYFSFDKKPSRAQIAPPSNSVWFARMSNTDKVLCFTEGTDNNLIISSGFAGFKAEEKVFLPFLFCTIRNDFFSNLKDSYSTGSTQVSINNKSINSIRFIEPEVQKIKEFGEKLYPSLEMINKLFVTNKKLKAARDILLPRLMNRTIEL